MTISSLQTYIHDLFDKQVYYNGKDQCPDGDLTEKSSLPREFLSKRYMAAHIVNLDGSGAGNQSEFSYFSSWTNLP